MVDEIMGAFGPEGGAVDEPAEAAMPTTDELIAQMAGDVAEEEPGGQAQDTPDDAVVEELNPIEGLRDFTLSINDDGDVFGLPDDAKTVVREAYDRVKGARDKSNEKLGRWAPLIDSLEQGGITDGAQAIRVGLQNQAGQQTDDPFGGKTMPNTPIIPQQPAPQSAGESQLDRVERLLVAQQGATQAQGVNESTVKALQQLGLVGDPLAIDYLNARRGLDADVRPPQEILREYVGKRSQSVQGIAAAKAAAAASTPDMRGGAGAPGLTTQRPNTGAMTDQAAEDLIAQVMSQAGAEGQ